MKSKRKSHESSVPAGSGAYRQGLRQADEVIAKHVVSEANPNNEAQDDERIVEHYDRAFRSDPRCALIEMWVARYILRTRSDFWRVRQMY